MTNGELGATGQKIYDFIRDSHAATGLVPTVREIREAIGVKSIGTVGYWLDRLEALNLIRRDAGKNRSIQLRGESPTVPVPLVGEIRAGSPILAEERVDPLALAQDAATALRPRAERAGVSLDVRGAAPAPEVDVDQVRIGEVLANLLTNAIRHTPRGGAVRVVVSPAPGGVAFAVSDTGPGIDARDLPHVFDRFVKSADSGGAGLGLAIARSLVEAHGGRITAESTTGAGTVMRFELPAVGNSTGSSG